MGKVTDELIALLSKQIQDHGIVVWYDPAQEYAELVERLELPETTILQFTGSFFELRYRMEPFLEFVDEDGRFKDDIETPPRLLVYLPTDRAKTQHALIEAEAAGVVMQPGASPWQRNTRLRVLAERVFREISPDQAKSIAAGVDAGRITIDELDRLADQSGDLGVVKLIFGTTAINDVVLAFIGSEEHDESIAKKDALPELSGLFRAELGLSVSPNQPVGQARDALCRSLLLTELALKIDAAGGDSSKLTAIGFPETAHQREQLLAFCHDWRNRSDLWEVYARVANKIEREAQVADLGLEASALSDVETFACIESMLVEWAEARILEGDLSNVFVLARRRKSSFWSLYQLEYQLRWTLLDIAARLLLTAERIETELKSIGKEPIAMINAYTDGIPRGSNEESLPWYLLDRHHRHLEHRYAMLDLHIDGSDTRLEKVITLVRKRYGEVTGKCAERFTDALRNAEFKVQAVLQQENIFQKLVRPYIADSKTAYILVDALRYEMGRELVEGLEDTLEVEILASLAQLPTITEVGMSALMPDAGNGMELVDVGSGRVGIKIRGVLLKDRASRIKYFRSVTGDDTLVCKLNDLMKPSKKEREAIAKADFILVTSQEIDRRGEETKDEEEARRFMNEVLEKLRRGIRRLTHLGVQHIVVAADHGHMFVERLEEAMKIDPPGGNTVDLHPRVWIGRGGAEAPGSLRVTANQIGLGGDLELAFPPGLACFRSRGSSYSYFHGGLSLQELLIPVVSITVHAIHAQGMGTASVNLTLAKPKITTRFFSIEVRYIVTGFFDAPTKRIKVIVRANRSTVGTAAMAAYGFEEGIQEIVLEKDKPNVITMMLTAELDISTVSVHVLDAITQVELAAVKDIPVEISI